MSRHEEAHEPTLEESVQAKVRISSFIITCEGGMVSAY